MMKTPTIDLGSLPSLETATGLFGSGAQSGVAYNDAIVALMVYVYDTLPPESLI